MKLIALAERLPDNARLFGGWGLDRELAAVTAELAHAHMLLFARANMRKRDAQRLPKPLRIPRPTDEAKKPSPGQKLRNLARMLKGSG